MLSVELMIGFFEKLLGITLMYVISRYLNSEEKVCQSTQFCAFIGIRPIKLSESNIFRNETFIVITLYNLNYCSQNQVKTIQKHISDKATRPYAQPGSQLATAP